MKKIIFFGLIFLIVIFIYNKTSNKKTYYLSLGDYIVQKISNDLEKSDKIDKYINYSTNDDYRLMDLINDINYNKFITYNNKEYRIQNLLVKANVITLSIGTNDLIYSNKLKNTNYDFFDELLVDLDKLFVIIRKYNKDKIYFLGFQDILNNEEKTNYLNKKLKKLCIKYNITYVDTTNRETNYILRKVLNFTKK